MEKGKLSLDELINKNILEIGVLIDKGFDVPTPKLKAFAENASKHLESIKNLSIEFSHLEKSYKIAPDRKKFLEKFGGIQNLAHQDLALSRFPHKDISESAERDEYLELIQKMICISM